MKLLIISDLHKEELWSKLFDYLKKYLKIIKPEVIVFNGDIFGEFERTIPQVNKKLSIKDNELLKLCAPKSSEKIIKLTDKVRQGEWLNEVELRELGRATIEYFKERYESAIKKIEELCKLGILVLYNLGNHESPNMAFNLLLKELNYMTKADTNLFIKALLILPQKEDIDSIFDKFINKIQKLEDEYDFKYISKKVFRSNSELHIGLSGLTLGYAPEKIFNKAREELRDGDCAIIYRHKKLPKPSEYYNRVISPNKPLWNFIKNLASKNIKVFLINSHHHWTKSAELHEQGSVFAKHESFYLLTNIAGIGGKINFVDTAKKEVLEIDFLNETEKANKLIALKEIK